MNPFFYKLAEAKQDKDEQKGMSTPHRMLLGGGTGALLAGSVGAALTKADQASMARRRVGFRDAMEIRHPGLPKELVDDLVKKGFDDVDSIKKTKETLKRVMKTNRAFQIGGGLAAATGIGLHLRKRSKDKEQTKTSAFLSKIAESESDEQNPYLIPGAIAGGGAGVAPGFALKSREAAKERGSAKKSIKETSSLISDLEGTKRAVDRADLDPKALEGLEDAMTKHKKELERLNTVKKKATKRMLGFGAGSTLAAAGAAYGGKKLYDTYKARNQDKTAAKAPTFSAAYDDSPELKGGQKRLPDGLQKKIVVSKLKSRIAKKRARRGDG